MKKITHLDIEKDEYKPETVRYYSDKVLILEVEDSNLTPLVGENVNIEGKLHLVVDVINYPELLIVDIIMIKND